MSEQKREFFSLDIYSYLIYNNIETAYNDPTNFIARKNMLHAAYLAGIAFSK